MKSLQNGPLWRLGLGVGVVALSCPLLGGSGADEKIGQIKQGLVGGEEVQRKNAGSLRLALAGFGM